MTNPKPFQAAFAGLASVELAGLDEYDLNGGAKLRPCYGYLLSPYMLAYKPAPTGGHRPAPWSAVENAQGHEYKVQLELQGTSDEDDAKEKIWWIAFLLRLAGTPFLTVPILSDAPLIPPKKGEPTPRLIPFEPYSRILVSGSDEAKTLKASDLEWVKTTWQNGLRLIKCTP